MEIIRLNNAPQESVLSEKWPDSTRTTLLLKGIIKNLKCNPAAARCMDYRRQEADYKKARHWMVEVCHNWFNRFRKLLVRHEKLERSFLALNHLAAAIIAFRKIQLAINGIYG